MPTTSRPLLCLAAAFLFSLSKAHAENPPPPSHVLIPDIEHIWEEPLLPVGLQKQLFTDDHVLSHRFNLHRELQQPQKVNRGRPLLTREKTWEIANLFQVACVNHDGNKFVMNYGYVGPVDYCCRAESLDGLTWTRPLLNLYEFDGNRENNLFDYRGYVSFLDPHETDPDHRYKAAYRPLESTTLPHAACLAHSPDGLHWTPYNNGHPVTGRAADTLSQLVWDNRAQLYRLFTRTDFGAGGGPTEYRGAREMINPDIKADPANWKTVHNWIFDREGPEEVKRRQIHTVNFWQHAGIDFGLMVVMEWPAFEVKPGQVGNDTSRHERDVWNCYLATRRGGHESPWDLSWIYAEKQFIPRGGPGSFDKDMIHPAASIVTHQDEHWIYYTGWPNGHMRHPYHPAIGLAKLPLDRFIALEPWQDQDPCWLITRPFKLEGKHLELNADLTQGELTAEFLDPSGNPVAGFSGNESLPLQKLDGLRLTPRFKDRPDLSPLLGQTLRLKLTWQHGKLFAFQFHN